MHLHFHFLYSFSLFCALQVSMPFARVIPKHDVVDGKRESSQCDSQYGRISPKIMIVSMFYPEADIWHAHMPRTSFGTLFARNISVAGLSPLYPQVHCTSAGEICHMTVGESEINAAASMTGLVLSNDFELTHTYFLTGGIAGVNPKLGTLGTVALAKFSVQVALQYEFDAREMPDNFSTGYLPYGADLPDQYPTISYGTEVMELNEALRDAAVSFASRAKLTDSTTTAEYRAKYQGVGETYTAATKIPAVIKGDSATSDVYYSGSLLSQAFENTTKIWTNQTAMTYCMTAQEDNAVLQALMRGHLAGRVDYSRAIVMRSGSDFDRPPPEVSVFEHLRVLDQNGFQVAIDNLFLAGIEIVKGIMAEWDSKYAEGIQPTNYIGDIFGSLGGQPGFGFGGLFGGVGARFDGSTYLGPRKRTAERGLRAGGMK